MNNAFEPRVVFALAMVCALFASSSQSVWLFVPALIAVVPWPRIWVRVAEVAALFLAGAILGLTPLWGLPHLAMLAIVLRHREHRVWALIACSVLAAPFLLVAASLNYTGWTVEAGRAAALASAAGLGTLFGFWGFGRPAVLEGRGRYAVIIVCVFGVVTTFPSPQWPAHWEVQTEGRSPSELHDLLRRRAAGERQSGFAAVGLWLEEYSADLSTVRANCPRMGFSPFGPSHNDDLIKLGNLACEATRGLPEQGIALLGTASHSRLVDLRSELEAETGLASADAPVWLLEALGRRPNRSLDWTEFNRRFDFGEPIPALVRGLRGDGAGKVRVSYSDYLGGFALTTITKRGGRDYRVAFPVDSETPIRAIVMEGVEHRGLWVDVADASGIAITWGCQVGSKPTAIELQATLCGGEPGSARIEFDRPIQIASLVLRGEYSLSRIAVELD